RLRAPRSRGASRWRGWPGTRRLRETWGTILRLLRGLFPADLLRVGPEALDVVELPLRLVEDVEHDVAEILQHPAGVLEALDPHLALAHLLEPHSKLLGDRARLALVGG